MGWELALQDSAEEKEASEKFLGRRESRIVAGW
jgi:hypothetical protein